MGRTAKPWALAITRSDKVLLLLLRILGVGSLFARIPVLMPFSWMVATHHWLGLGGMPTGPVVLVRIDDT